MQVLPNKAPGHISALVQKPQLPRSCGELSQILVAASWSLAALLLARFEEVKQQLPDPVSSLLYAGHAIS